MIDQYPPSNGVLTSLIWRKTMSGGETSLSGYDNASQALSYTPGQEQVYLNGILLVRGDDYTATNGTSITGLSALAANDFVQVNCYNNFSVATLPTSGLTGTISNAQLQNSSITINGSAVSLGGSTTIAGGSAQDDAPTSPTEGQLWLDTNGTLATTAFTEKSTLTTTGDIYYASAANTPARLGIGSTDQVLKVSGGVPVWGSAGSTLVGVQATLSSEQTISSATYTAITFNTEANGFDTDAFHDNTTNNSRFTVPTGKGGYYLMIGRVIVAGNQSSTWNNRCKIRKNGSTDLAFGYSNAAAAGDVTTFTSCVSNLSAGDYVEFIAYQNSGSNRNLQSNLSEIGPTMFTMIKVGD